MFNFQNVCSPETLAPRKEAWRRFIVRKGRRIAFAAIVAFHNRGLWTDQSCFHKTRNLGTMLLQTRLENAEIGVGENVGEVEELRNFCAGLISREIYRVSQSLALPL